MKIAVIAGDRLRGELAARPYRRGLEVEWIWMREPGELEACRDADLYMDLEFILNRDRMDKLTGLLPAPVIVNSVVHTLGEIGQPFIRINAWPGFLERSVHELVVPDGRMAEAVALIYGRLDWQYRVVADIPGMISARVLAAVINEAYYTLESGISTREEIDTAMRLGTNYPWGPFEWGERIGPMNIYQLLVEMSRKEARYNPSEALLESTNRD